MMKTAFLGMALSAACLSLVADQVTMRNGDRYVGRVVSLSGETVVIESELLGTMRLARGQVEAISLDQRPSGQAPSTRHEGRTNGVSGARDGLTGTGYTNATSAKAGLSISTNLVQQVQKQFLSGASPEAQQQFNDLVEGLMSGKLTVENIRTQAQALADQVRASRKDLGEEDSWAIDGYLAILDRFLKRTAPESEKKAPPATGDLQVK